MSIISTRIDYLRFTAPQSQYLDETAWKLQMEELFLQFCVPQGEALTKHGEFNRYYDNAARIWVLTFEAWGAAADALFDECARHRYGTILRVDYRFEVDRPGVKKDTVYYVAKRNKGKSRRTITNIDSPPRTKAGDRDAGGDFLAIGSKGSERRFTMYKRGKENWAVEVQFGKGVPQRISAMTYEKFIEDTKGDKPWQDLYREALHQMALEAITDMSHFGALDVLGETDPDYDPAALDFQESLLSGLEMNLPGMEALTIQTAIDALSRELDRRAIISTGDLEEPEGFWPISD